MKRYCHPLAIKVSVYDANSRSDAAWSGPRKLLNGRKPSAFGFCRRTDQVQSKCRRRVCVRSDQVRSSELPIQQGTKVEFCINSRPRERSVSPFPIHLSGDLREFASYKRLRLFSRSDGDCDLSQTQPPQSLALRGDDFERSASGAI